MKIGFQIFFLLLWLYLIFLCALVLFTKGFLLKRVVVNNSSECELDNWTINNLQNGVTKRIQLHSETYRENSKCGRTVKPKFKKAILVIIDGLRYDFLLWDKDLKKPLPYQNKMKKLHGILQREPNNGKLYRFLADPPTTTMQRIKGITTGSLPTFIDAGTNFNSYHITEDNILDQALKQNKNISFMGCSTWTELFPNHFHRKIPFSALNVKDLDTIDYGIMKHLVPEVRRSDWSIIIAHFLGVDHCGHRYGTHHHEMTRKLTEMDNVISDLTSAIDNDTILFVMGDHGMTISGDHGGDSKDEVMAGLFVYSKKRLFTKSESMNLPQVSQIDLVPTLSLLLDQPIPFSNLGAIIPDIYTGDPMSFVPKFIEYSSTNQTLLELSSRLFKHINLAYVSLLNCHQVIKYIEEYQLVSGDLPRDRIAAVHANLEFMEEKFYEITDDLIDIDWLNSEHISISDVEEAILELSYLQSSLQDTLSNIQLVCRSVWAKFDLVSITMGLSLMFLISILTIITPYLINNDAFIKASKIFVLIYFVGFIFAVISLIYLALPFEDVDMSSFVVFLGASFSFSLWLISSHANLTFNVKQTIGKCKSTVMNFRNMLIPVCFTINLFMFFSNSFIIHEDTVVLYICETFLVCHICSNTVSMIKENRRNFTISKGFSHLRTRYTQLFLNKEVGFRFGKVFFIMISLRWTKYFWFCREMQLKCNLSTYALPLAFLLSEFSEGLANERILLALFSLTLLCTVTYMYLKCRGNLHGSSAYDFCFRYITLFSAVVISVHWVLQLVLTHQLSVLYNLSYTQQIILPRIVYILFIFGIGLIVYNPLCIHVVISPKFQVNNTDSYHQSIIEIYNKMRSRNMEKPNKAPIVVGLATVYSSSLILLMFLVAIVAVMVSADGMTFPFMLLWFSGYFIVRTFSYVLGSKEIGYGDILSLALVWHYFTSAGFFGTSHQATLPAIKYQTAYIGFKGSIPEIIPQVMVLLLNTFSSQIMCSLAVPLLFLMRFTAKKQQKENERKGEVEILENVFESRLHLFKIMIFHSAALMLKVSFCAASAALHRRHLMVWKIFAPRFLFEAVGFLISIPIMLLGYGYFLRIDNALRRWQEKLEESVSAEFGRAL